jgi:hypothetical protein
MVKVKSRAIREANYRAAIPGVAAKYKNAVQATTGVIEAAKAGQGLYVERMTDSNVLARRLSGLNKVTDADWQNGAANKGASRIGPGMEAAASKQAANYDPIAQALEAVSLPPRTSDANTNIDNRVKPIVAAMKRAAGKV